MNITVRMPYLLSNIPSSMIYGSIYLELLQIALCALRLTDLYIYIYIYLYIYIYIIIIIIVLVLIIIIIALDSVSLELLRARTAPRQLMSTL